MREYAEELMDELGLSFEHRWMLEAIFGLRPDQEFVLSEVEVVGVEWERKFSDKGYVLKKERWKMDGCGKRSSRTLPDLKGIETSFLLLVLAPLFHDAVAGPSPT